MTVTTNTIIIIIIIYFVKHHKPIIQCLTHCLLVLAAIHKLTKCTFQINWFALSFNCKISVSVIISTDWVLLFHFYCHVCHQLRAVNFEVVCILILKMLYLCTGYVFCFRFIYIYYMYVFPLFCFRLPGDFQGCGIIPLLLDWMWDQKHCWCMSFS